MADCRRKTFRLLAHSLLLIHLDCLKLGIDLLRDIADKDDDRCNAFICLSFDFDSQELARYFQVWDVIWFKQVIRVLLLVQILHLWSTVISQLEDLFATLKWCISKTISYDFVHRNIVDDRFYLLFHFAVVLNSVVIENFCHVHERKHFPLLLENDFLVINVDDVEFAWVLSNQS